MGGCLRNFLASVGCLTLLSLGSFFGWHYRAELLGLYRSLRREVTADSPPPGARAAGRATGRATLQALSAARRKQELIGRPGGPPYVVLDASEMAALIVDGLAPAARRALDSVEVVLLEDRFLLRAQLLTAALPGLLGPLAGMFDRSELLAVAGPARVTHPGVVAWEPDSFVVRAFPFPREAIASLVNQLSGGSDGAFLIPVPETVVDLKMTREGVVFYRRVER